MSEISNLDLGSSDLPANNDPSLDTVAALTMGQRAGQTTIFVGTRAGLYCTTEPKQATHPQWQRLPLAPTEILALGVSPTYAEDSTILAGAGHGLFRSSNGGAHWTAVHTPMSNSAILCLGFSPNYRVDGIILAGTLEDGVYYTNNRGERWSYRGFGLLDAAVYALTISPNFAHDEMLFAGTETALYYSYNGARAWKQLDFPEESTPILSLALSPQFGQDQTIYAGTEQHGLYRSTDLGKSWQHADLPATCVNALAVALVTGHLYAAINAGLYRADGTGAAWTCLLDRPDAFSLTVNNDCLVVGLIEQGAWLTTDHVNWRLSFPPPCLIFGLGAFSYAEQTLTVMRLTHLSCINLTLCATRFEKLIAVSATYRGTPSNTGNIWISTFWRSCSGKVTVGCKAPFS